jgi:hypothetical protein
MSHFFIFFAFFFARATVGVLVGILLWVGGRAACMARFELRGSNFGSGVSKEDAIEIDSSDSAMEESEEVDLKVLGGGRRGGSTRVEEFKWDGEKGGRYVGGTCDGELNGEGEMEWSDGSTYKGSFELGLRNGKGSFFSGDKGEGYIEYVGEWRRVCIFFVRVCMEAGCTLNEGPIYCRI